MALIKCAECGKKVSDKSEVCVHCGFPIKKMNEENKESQVEQEGKKDNLHKKRKAAIIAAAAACAIIAVVMVVVLVVIPGGKYNDAVALMNEGKYDEAIAAFEALDNYGNSKEKINECKYKAAVELMNDGKYDEAIAAFEALDNYSDSKDKISECKYRTADKLLNEGKYEEAAGAFEKLGEYSDSLQKAKECKYKYALALLEAGQDKEALAILEALEGYGESAEKINEYKYNSALELIDEGKIIEAYDALIALGEYKDSADKAESIEKTYNRIKAKPKIFVTAEWMDEWSQRCHLSTDVLDENTVNVFINWANDAWSTTNWEFTGKWDEKTGRLNYKNGRKYISYSNDEAPEDYIYVNGSGYFYYQNGYLYWVDNKEKAGANCRFN